MDDMSKSNALILCQFLEDRGAINVLGLDLGPQCSWASHLIIGTVTSHIHMQGLSVALKKQLDHMGIATRNGVKRSEQSSWRMIDGGEIVVSLMDSDARNFYALEERWFESDSVFRSQPA